MVKNRNNLSKPIRINKIVLRALKFKTHRALKFKTHQLNTIEKIIIQRHVCNSLMCSKAKRVDQEKSEQTKDDNDEIVMRREINCSNKSDIFCLFVFFFFSKEIEAKETNFIQYSVPMTRLNLYSFYSN